MQVGSALRPWRPCPRWAPLELHSRTEKPSRLFPNGPVYSPTCLQCQTGIWYITYVHYVLATGKNEWMNMDGWMDGWMDGRMDGWMDGWMMDG